MTAGAGRVARTGAYPTGTAHPPWKGDAALPETKRSRAVRRYELGMCEHEGCSARARDRHHVDGDTGNNEPENIRRLCRRHHMEEDGRLAALAASCPPLRPPTPCCNCGAVPKDHMRRGRCGTCYAYLNRTGRDREVLR